METAQRYVYPIDLTEQHFKLQEICAKMTLSKAEAIREALNYYYEHVKGIKVIELREISEKQAEKEILDYLGKHKNAYTSEIADELRLDVVLVNKILINLAQGGRVK